MVVAACSPGTWIPDCDAWIPRAATCRILSAAATREGCIIIIEELECGIADTLAEVGVVTDAIGVATVLEPAAAGV